jgi:hypothetical protein
MKRWIAVILLVVLSVSLFTACSPDKSGGIKVAETYLNHLINGEYEAAYDLLSDYDKANISKETYLKWKDQVAQIIKIKSATVDSQVDRFNNYKYQGTVIGYALGLKIKRVQDVLIPDIELDGYNKDSYRQMVVYENKQWKMLLLLTKLDETVAGYQALLDKYGKK